MGLKFKELHITSLKPMLFILFLRKNPECKIFDLTINPNKRLQDIEELRAKRNKICDLVGVSQPKLLKSSKPKPKASTVEQFDSYSDLVGRAGY